MLLPACFCRDSFTHLCLPPFKSKTQASNLIVCIALREIYNFMSDLQYAARISISILKFVK